MARQIVLLRGINVGGHKRVPMPQLRELLEGAGHANVRSYVQSGNVVLDSDAAPGEPCAGLARLIADAFGFEVDVLVRTRDELAAAVERNPFEEAVAQPKLFQVTFLDREPEPERVQPLAEADHSPEQVAFLGREIYAWHPNGMRDSKLARALSNDRLGVTATARNWNTVTKLLEMADE